MLRSLWTVGLAKPINNNLIAHLVSKKSSLGFGKGWHGHETNFLVHFCWLWDEWLLLESCVKSLLYYTVIVTEWQWTTSNLVQQLKWEQKVGQTFQISMKTKALGLVPANMSTAAHL